MTTGAPIPGPPAPAPDALTTRHVRRAIDGDQASVAWLVGRLSPLLVAHAAFRMGSALRRSCDPEDLVNDAWLLTLPRLAGLSPRDGRHTPVLLRFLSTCVLRRIHGLMRAQARERAASGPNDADALAALPAQTSGVVTRVVRHELQAEVRAAIDELEPLDREVLLLRGIEQQDNQTAALLLGVTPDVATKRYQRALRRLRRRLPNSVFDELDGAP